MKEIIEVKYYIDKFKLGDIIIDLLVENNNEFIFSSLDAFSKTLNVSYRNLTRVLRKLTDENIIIKVKNKIKLIK